jgi:hypothetical protein
LTAGALAAWLAAGGTGGTVLVAALLIVAAAGIYGLSRRTPVTAATVDVRRCCSRPSVHCARTRCDT